MKILLRAVIVYAISLALMPCVVRGSESAGAIAVLGFENLTGDTSLNWMGSGISESLTAKLANVPGLQIVERLQLSKIMSEQALSQTGAIADSTAAKVGMLAGATTVVAGAFQKTGEQVRITARFIDAETGAVTKATEATGAMSELFSLQDKVALNLLESQGVAVSDTVRAEVTANPTQSLPALEKNGSGMAAYTAGSVDAAVSQFQAAIQIDPDYAQAHYNLGNALMRQRRYDPAIAEYRVALRIRPSFAEAHIRLAYCYEEKGMPRKARAEYQEALRTRPKSAALFARHHGSVFNKPLPGDNPAGPKRKRMKKRAGDEQS